MKPLEQLLKLLKSGDFHDLAIQIMRSGNHTDDELLGVLRTYYADTIHNKIRYALNLEATQRDLKSGFGLDFLIPIFGVNAHVCIILDRDKKNYHLDCIHLFINDDLTIFAPPARFTRVPIKYKFKKRIGDTVHLTDKYLNALSDSFMDVFLDETLAAIQDKKILA